MEDEHRKQKKINIAIQFRSLSCNKFLRPKIMVQLFNEIILNRLFKYLMYIFVLFTDENEGYRCRFLLEDLVVFVSQKINSLK